ncbi:MAG: hypothetical protein A2Y10_11365 [Planctomycetes bacterium GWF2_41_51]|nr:MAG: hypothetical protein A2Y10_11365 [Planctomycetes bacterium GWF2_41_51]HBG28529.1 hypothetical protein [Phycisphaerales bacterium]
MDEKKLIRIIEKAAEKKTTKLNLSNKNIKKLPVEIGQLTNLVELILNDNHLTALPVEIVKIKKLKKLELSKNNFVAFPPEILQLPKIEELTLNYNKLEILPAEIAMLGQLKELNLWENRLLKIPIEIAELSQLRYLNLGNNKLTVLPEFLELKQLDTLWLSMNPLITMPDWIGELAQLRCLGFHSCQLNTISPKIINLSKLDTLVLYNNKFNDIPPEFCNLNNLVFLFLSNNQVSRLPREFGKLNKLKKLDFSNNNFIEIPPEIGQLHNLEELNFSKNKLTKLPSELGNLVKLKELYLYSNNITTLEPSIVHLKKLKKLYLHKNRLFTIPQELGQLQNIRELSLKNNPLESPPQDVIQRGTQAILAYLRELEKGGKKRYETKLLILGYGNEGKTCVSRALQKLPFWGEHIRTPGVEIAQWKVENPKFPKNKEKEITLNIWDFEGQEINHQSHQFFLTEKSLYLLVINSTKLFKWEHAEYWLNTIRARAPQSRVILVATECEETTPAWPFDRLKEDYGDLLQGDNWFFLVGCKSGKGIDALSAEIVKAASEIKQMGIDWPVSYQKAEDEIRKLVSEKQARIDRTELYDIFAESGIDKENFENAAAEMGVQGLITQFKDSLELENFIVLNPQWLTKGISLVMEDGQLEKDKGEISHTRMKKIWDNGYNGLYPILHSCMKEFELLYDMEDMQGCLVPLRFGDKRPDTIPWSNLPNINERRIEYKLNIQPPAGIMSRFIVKTHYMIVKTKDMPKGVYWQNGVFLQTGVGEFTSQALCEFDYNEKILQITVRAAFPQNMIEQLHGTAKAVFGFFEGLKPERRYGCIKFEQYKEQYCEGVHPELKILYGLSKNKEIDCEKGWHGVDPKKLVYGFSSFGENALTVKELRQELDKKPEWAENLIKDVETSLVWIDKTYEEIIRLRKHNKKLGPEIIQEMELRWRNYLDMVNEMLDNRDFNSAPAIISMMPIDGSKFIPANWFNKEYIVRPYCECEEGIHPINYTCGFKKPKEWWVKTAPKLAIGVKILSAGIKIACAGLPLAVGTEVFQAVEKEAEFMKELADHLELEGGAESDISAEGCETVEALRGKTAVRDLRQFGENDEKRIARMKLAELFSEIAPDNYKSQQWGELRRVRIRSDNTYRWLCGQHAKKYKS